LSWNSTLLWNSIENTLQRHRTIQSRGRDISTVRNPFTLCVFPMAAVKEPRGLESRPIDAIEAACIHRDLIWLSARHIEGVHATVFAEWMLSDAGAKRINRQRLLTAEKLEIRGKDWQMIDSLLCADRAAALR